jgi:hypothetical protein
VVEMVRVAVAAAVPVMLTGLVEPKLRVGRFCAPLGPAMRVAVSVTLPVKPPNGVTVMADVFPAVAPGLTVTAVPATTKPEVPACATVTDDNPEEKLYVEELAASGIYLAIRTSATGAVPGGPTSNDPAGISIVALPPLRVAAAEE